MRVVAARGTPGRRTARREAVVDARASRSGRPRRRCRCCRPAPSRAARRRPPCDTRLGEVEDAPCRRGSCARSSRASRGSSRSVPKPRPPRIRRRRPSFTCTTSGTESLPGWYAAESMFDGGEAEEVRAVEVPLALEQLVLRIAPARPRDEQAADQCRLDPLRADHARPRRSRRGCPAPHRAAPRRCARVACRSRSAVNTRRVGIAAVLEPAGDGVGGGLHREPVEASPCSERQVADAPAAAASRGSESSPATSSERHPIGSPSRIRKVM